VKPVATSLLRRFAARGVFPAVLLLSASGLSAQDLPEVSGEAASPASTQFSSSVPTSVILGVTDVAVVFGQSAPLSGPNAQIGLEARLGILAAFNEINQKGGVHGRRVQLVTLDDNYEPGKAIRNVKRLIEKDGVFALIGNVGTSPVRASAPISAEAGVPFIAPVTGAAELRARWQNMMHLRASYDQETEAMIDHLLNDLSISRIAVLYQNDSFGRDGFEGVSLALSRRGAKVVSSGFYERNTSAIKQALLEIRQGKPEAVIIIASYPAAAQLILWSRFIGFNPVFMNISFVSSNALARELGSKGGGVFMTQVVPFPTSPDLAVTQAYQKALATVAPETEPGFTSFEGYLTGRLVTHILEECGRNLTREMFLDAFRNAGLIDLDDFQLYYSEGIDQGSQAVFLTVLDEEGNYRPITRLTDAVNAEITGQDTNNPL